MKTAAQIAGAFFGAAVIGAIGYVALSAGTVSTVAAAQSLSISNPGACSSVGICTPPLTTQSISVVTDAGGQGINVQDYHYSPNSYGSIEIGASSLTYNPFISFPGFTVGTNLNAAEFNTAGGTNLYGGNVMDYLDAGIIQAARYLDPPPSVLVDSTLPTTLPNTTLGLTALGAGFKPTIAAFAYVIKTAGVGTAVETIQVADTGGNICYIGVPCTQALGNWTVTTGFDGTCTFNAGQPYQLQFGPIDAGTSCTTAPVFQSISASAQIVHN